MAGPLSIEMRTRCLSLICVDILVRRGWELAYHACLA
uniref:Uncharacterized protein n=1 Tax=Echinococcus granulosus TaxID=6210 RepID=A0A068WSU5_ECHGR|nr:hypothetical protein EgrG_001145600 [Echinococcus granulosus]